MTYDAKRFGLQMKALRGDLLQPAVEKLSGVPQYTISKIESGTVAHPSFDVICKLCQVYGVEPNDVAAMAGIWPTPNVEDNQAISRDGQRVVTMIQNLLMLMDHDRQRELTRLLEGVVRIEQAELAQDTLSKEADSILPDFLKRQVRNRR